MVSNRILTGNIILECMSTFMCDNIHISAGSVKISKNKRYTIIRKFCHISACSLIFASENIKQLILHHHIKEISCLIGHLRIHFTSAFKNFLRCSCRCRISLWEIYPHIIVTKSLYSKTRLAILMHLRCKRYKHGLNLITKLLNVLFGVRITVHTAIAHINIILKSKHLCLFGTVLHHKVIDFVNLRLILLEEFRESIPCLLTCVTVR